MFEKSEKTILIVDDTPENVDILRGLLSDYRLAIAINGKIALKIANLNPKPDLILLDIMMPEMNGFQVCEELKKNPETKSIPIIFITALSETENLVKSFELGAVDYITKPFNHSEVMKRVETHLSLSHYQKRLENINFILEEKVQKRTEELRQLNSELVVAKNKAEDINKLKSFFIQNISHELRTPLITILGFSEIISNESENSDYKEFGREIFDAGQRLQKTLNDIIALTDLENKKLEVAYSNIDVIKTIKRTIEHYKPIAEKKGLSFKFSSGMEKLMYITDDNLLTYILFSIVDNAIKFTKQGGIHIGVSGKTENSIPYLVIDVTDTGIGISPEKLGLIFSLFRQESEGYSRDYEGMGIGLTIAKQLTEILKGEISLSSNPGKGTKVTIRFPLAQDEKEVSFKVDQAKRQIIPHKVEAGVSKPMLLLVEDNESNRFLLKKMMQNYFTVEEAADGISALAMFEMKSYDIVLMDINLGAGIDGIEVCRRIRRSTKNNGIPVIAVTAFAMREEREKYLDFGFTDLIQKPALKEDFLTLLKKYIVEK